MKKLILSVSLFLGALLGAAVGFGGGMPTIPSVPSFNEPSQIISTLNQYIATLNGFGTGINNNVPAVYTLGGYCTASGATPQTCNSQRGLVTTASLSTAAATNAAFVINNSLVTAASVCRVNVASYSGTLVTNGYPQPLTVVSGAGTITVNLTNTHAANALSGTVGLAFDCIQ